MTEDAGGTSMDTRGLRSHDQWQFFFSRFDHFVLVANSEEQELRKAQANVQGKVLFIFFNKVDRVLDEVFPENAILVTRSNQAGSELVYKGTLGRMLRFFSPKSFQGVLNLRTVDYERLNEPEDFGSVSAGFMDLADFCSRFYPSRHAASSGFALALWLSKHVPDGNIYLTGFTGQRGERWKVFHTHDWTFEQTALRLLRDGGYIRSDFDADERVSYDAFLELFPGISKDAVANCRAQILGERMEGMNRQIDMLISSTSPLRFFRTMLQKIRGKSRKERALARQASAQPSREDAGDRP